MAWLYVQHTYSNEIRVFDEARAYELCGTIALGDSWRPDSVVLSADGATLYSNWKDMSYLRAAVRTPSRSLFMAHDARTLAEQWRLPLDGAVEHFAASPDKRTVWNAVSDRPWMIRVDVEARTADYVQITSQGGHKVRVSADGLKCYVGSIMTCELTEVDTQTLKRTRVAPFDDYVRPFDLSRDGQTAYVQLSRMHGLVEFDLPSWSIRRRIGWPKLPPETPVETAFPFTVDHGAEVTPDDELILLLATTGNHMIVCQRADFSIVAVIPLGVEPSYLTLSPDAQRVYVTNRVSGDVYVVDRATWDVVARFETGGKRPQRLCVSA
ncbi:MAG: hypothetical protein AAF648_06895 [Pseudomonadota bacterium]